MKQFIILFSICLLLAQLTIGQTEQVKYGNDFLNIGVGARAFGMGNAHVAVVNDVNAGYWNPAGLIHRGSDQHAEVSLMHAAYFANIANYNHIGLSIPLDSVGSKRLGLTLIRLGIDDIPNTLSLIREDGSFDYNSVSSFSASDLATLISYAWSPKFLEGLSVGGNLKVIYRGAGRFGNAWGFGLDIGAKYQRKGLQVGLSLRDATNTFNAWTFNTETFEDAFINTGNEIPQNSVLRVPMSIRLGLAYTFHITHRLNLLTAVDGDIFLDGRRATSLISSETLSIDPHAGFELAYLNDQKKPIVFLRGGVYNLQNEKNTDGVEEVGLFPTAGVGVVLKNLQLDYALANIGDLSQNLHSHVVSLKIHIK